MTTTPVVEEDRTGRARIRDAAIARFAEQGVDGTSIKAIAEDAGVSPGLVIHHFGSKRGLRAACDQHVVAVIGEQKRAAMSQGPQLDLLATLRESAEGPPILRYLARTLGDGSPEVVVLVDGMVDAGVAAVEEGVRAGLLAPVDQPREVTIVLVLWSLGLLTLHRHAERLLGIDLTGGPEGRRPYMRIAMEALRGLFTEEAYEQLHRALATEDEGEQEPR